MQSLINKISKTIFFYIIIFKHAESLPIIGKENEI